MITVLFTLVIMLMLLVMPWDPIPLSFIPYAKQATMCINEMKHENITVMDSDLPGRENDRAHEPGRS